MGYVQSWNISFQRELTRDTVLDLRYTGNHESMVAQLQPERNQHLENGFLNEFQTAQNNLTIARGGNINQNTGVDELRQPGSARTEGDYRFSRRPSVHLHCSDDAPRPPI